MNEPFEQSTNRIDWIDVAKGIGIILVCLGHMDGITSAEWKQFAAMFHMPLFFFLSGLLYAKIPSNKYSISAYSKKQFHKLLLPYILWGLIYAQDVSIENIARILWGNNELFGYAGLWFLPVMFLASIEFYFIRNKFRKPTSMAVIGTLFVLLARILQVMGDKTILRRTGYPLGFDISLLACGFMILGFLLGSIYIEKFSYRLNCKRNLFIVTLISVALLFCAVYVLSIINRSYVEDTSLQRVVVATADYGNYVVFVVGAVCGVCATVLLAKLISRNRALEYIGKNSLVYMVTNHFAISCVTDLYNMFFDIENIVSHLLLRLILVIVTTILTLTLCTLFCVLLNKFFPFLTGNDATNMVRK